MLLVQVTCFVSNIFREYKQHKLTMQRLPLHLGRNFWYKNDTAVSGGSISKYAKGITLNNVPLHSSTKPLPPPCCSITFLQSPVQFCTLFQYRAYKK
jgi:hypothetical protein